MGCYASSREKRDRKPGRFLKLHLREAQSVRRGAVRGAGRREEAGRREGGTRRRLLEAQSPDFHTGQRRL